MHYPTIVVWEYYAKANQDIHICYHVHVYTAGPRIMG